MTEPSAGTSSANGNGAGNGSTAGRGDVGEPASPAREPYVVKGLAAEKVAPTFPKPARNPFPIFGQPEIGTTPRSRGHRESEPRRPEWLKIQLDTGENFKNVRKMVDGLNLHTVCQEARCPNIYECWSDRTATFMIFGDTCTRHCTFCAISRAKEGLPLDPAEPRNVANAIAHLELAHAVITSVNRDDLADGGASHFAETIREARERNPDCRIEVLIPDFCGNWDALRTVLDAEPHVLNHNTETVQRLYPKVRPDADYRQSLRLLEIAAGDKAKRAMYTKSGLMLGLGETRAEVRRTLEDLRAVDCDIVTMGQYLSPSRKHLGVEKYYTPAEFDELREEGLALGFRFVESGPLVRSSYHARRHAEGARES
ncbi:MAG: lipoyl synthase [bacterium]